MEPSILAACLLLLTALAGLCWCVRGVIVPSPIAPLCRLSPDQQLDVLRRRTRLRCLAICCFVAAAASALTGVPRGVTVILAVGGFCLQYLVYRSRVHYPAAGTFPVRETVHPAASPSNRAT